MHSHEDTIQPTEAKVPRIDTSIITASDLDSIGFPKRKQENGHAMYDLDYSWKSISERLFITNELISDFEDSFNNLHKYVASVDPGERDPVVFNRYIARGEIVVSALKTSADQLLSLLSILKSKSSTGTYGNEIDKDCIGEYLTDSNLKGGILDLIKKHAPVLREINDSVNGIKHSFLNLHVNTYETKPTILVYYLPYNRLDKKGCPVTVVPETAIPEYNDFLRDVKKLIIEYANAI